MKYQVNLNETTDFLLSILRKSISPEALDWLTQKLELLSGNAADKDLYLAFSSAPRFTGKNLLKVEESDLLEAERLRPGFDPSRWTVDQAARTLLLLALPHDDEKVLASKLFRLFNTADMGELVALYASLHLLPYPHAFVKQAAEGVRTNMGNVFEAIALDNPYPADYFEEGAWNQMVLKTVFVGKPLYRIYDLEKRSNPTLARILSDYAHERWAAGRSVTPELWRPVGPFIDERIIEDIKKLFAHPDVLQHQAAALACAQGSYLPARELLENYPDLKKQVETGELNWNLIGNKALIQN
ncbi:hypothetical protein OB13_07875 [Pontibacter sp. HJ8]